VNDQLPAAQLLVAIPSLYRWHLAENEAAADLIADTRTATKASWPRRAETIPCRRSAQLQDQDSPRRPTAIPAAATSSFDVTT